MGRDRSLSRHFRYGTFPLVSAAVLMCPVLCCFAELAESIVVQLFRVFAIKDCIEDYSILFLPACGKKAKYALSVVSKFDYSSGKPDEKTLNSSKTLLCHQLFILLRVWSLRLLMSTL